MATKHGGSSNWYTKRSYPAIGRVCKSLGTSRKQRADALEDMLLSLCDQGRIEVVQAWVDGDVSLSEIAHAYDTQTLPELSQKIRTSDMPLEDGCDEALRMKKAHVKASTYERYKTSFKHFKRVARKELGPDATVRDALDDDFLDEYKVALIEQGFAEQTINNHLMAPSLLATRAVKKGWIENRPTIKRYEPKERISHLESGGVAAYMAALRPAFRVQMQLCFGAGFALGETEELRVCDLRLGDGEPRAHVRDSKKAKTPSRVRWVDLPHWLADALRQHVEEHELSGTDKLFTIKRRTVQAEHNRACGIAGIADYTIHDHRHTYAVSMVRAGMPMPMVRDQMGHKNIETTMKYATFNPDYSETSPYHEEAAKDLGLARDASQGKIRGNVPDSECSEVDR